MRSSRAFSLRLRALVMGAAVIAAAALVAAPAGAAVGGSSRQSTRAAAPEQGGSSLEDAAARAGSTGRAVAMSLIGLALAVAATVLAFRRDFKEAAGVFAVGIVAVLLATPSGVSLLKDTVASLFGGQ
ncbi:MAG TPA: hypothetical protein VNV44_05895 [Solirubrobacteraceae bacterium]|jgi:hypothetical protein|nr:hypothetical protein [Solirubrobacteraceae bacterium]